MHLHLVRVAARPKPVPRPAKVVQLEVRRKARLDAVRRTAAGRVNEEPHALQDEPAAPRADVAEPEYAPASEAGGRVAMRVRLPPSASQREAM